jgi:flagellar assembly protein FliH
LSTSDDIVLRGRDAARAQRIDLVAATVSTGADGLSLSPTGPWATNIQDAFDAARQEGYAVGRQEGWEVGLTQGTAEAREETAQLAEMIEQLIRAVHAEVTRVTDQVAGGAAATALAIAEAILAREVASADDPGAEAIARCLAAAPLTGAVVAHVHPDDLARLGPIPGVEGSELSLVPDASLARGDAVVMVDQTMIDGRLGSALERVGEVLA